LETKICRDVYKIFSGLAIEKKCCLIDRDNKGLLANEVHLTNSTQESEDLSQTAHSNSLTSNIEAVRDGTIEREVDLAFDREDIQDEIIGVNIDRQENVTNFLQREEKYEYIGIACDGAFAQIDALLNHLNDKFIRDNLKITLVKYSGGCSMTQSTNDQGKMHTILHSCFRSSSFRYEDCEDPHGVDWKQLKDLMTLYLDGSSFKTIWKCMCNASDFLEKASYTRRNVPRRSEQ
jgi:hypothetical protein